MDLYIRLEFGVDDVSGAPTIPSSQIRLSGICYLSNRLLLEVSGVLRHFYSGYKRIKQEQRRFLSALNIEIFSYMLSKASSEPMTLPLYLSP